MQSNMAANSSSANNNQFQENLILKVTAKTIINISNDHYMISSDIPITAAP